MKQSRIVLALALAALAAACDQAPTSLDLADLTPQFTHNVQPAPLNPRAEVVWVCKIGPAAGNPFSFTVDNVAGTITNLVGAGFTVNAGWCVHVATGSPGTPNAQIRITENEAVLPIGVQYDSVVVSALGTVPTVISGSSAQVQFAIPGVSPEPPSGAVITFYNSLTPGANGCTPGYWKQPHHFGSWTAPYTPTTLFSAVFENAFPGQTLLQVVSNGGGGLDALGRHTVAALLNAANPAVGFPMTTAQVIAAFNAVFPGTKAAYTAKKDVFAALNEAGCNLGRAAL